MRRGQILSMSQDAMGERRCRKAGDIEERQKGHSGYMEQKLRNIRLEGEIGLVILLNKCIAGGDIYGRIISEISG